MSQEFKLERSPRTENLDLSNAGIGQRTRTEVLHAGVNHVQGALLEHTISGAADYSKLALIHLSKDIR